MSRFEITIAEDTYRGGNLAAAPGICHTGKPTRSTSDVSAWGRTTAEPSMHETDIYSWGNALMQSMAVGGEMKLAGKASP